MCLEPGAQGRTLSEVTTELRDRRWQGTEGDILADQRPAEPLCMNKDFGIQRERDTGNGASKRPS